MQGDKGDIPQFVEAVQKLRPKFFVMDNLPKSLIVADWAWYMENLPDYDIHFEVGQQLWIGNGNRRTGNDSSLLDHSENWGSILSLENLSMILLSLKD